MDEKYLGNTVTEIPAFHKNVKKKDELQCESRCSDQFRKDSQY